MTSPIGNFPPHEVSIHIVDTKTNSIIFLKICAMGPLCNAAVKTEVCLSLNSYESDTTRGYSQVESGLGSWVERSAPTGAESS